MPPSTPPATTHDHKPAHDWADAMRGCSDGMLAGAAVWHRWALVEAYMAGRAAAIAEREGNTTEYVGE